MKRNGSEVNNFENEDNMKHPRSSASNEDEEQKKKQDNSTVDTEQKKNQDNSIADTKDDSSSTIKSRFLVVNGIRYVRPYMTEKPYSLRIQNVGKIVAVVLAEAFHRRSNELEDTISYFRREIQSGRVQLERHRTSRDDNGPFSKFSVLLDPERIAAKGDRFKIRSHCHERCTIYRGPLQTINVFSDNNNNKEAFRAVFKPAGLPVVDEVGGYGTVMGLLEDNNYRPGHRLDRPVSGILLLAKGKGGASRLIKALAPESKQKKDSGILKAYVARVEGQMGSEPQEIKVKLKWDNTIKKAVVSEDEKGRDTVTRVTLIRWDVERGESIVRVELGSGARHQIRAVLSSYLNLPIIGDVTYGGEPFIYEDNDHCDNDQERGDINQCQPNEARPKKELRLYADDKEGRLLDMLHQERVDWCDKCRWQVEETENGGTERGTERLADYICLLSYQYRIPSLGIDVCVPEEMMPTWAK